MDLFSGSDSPMSPSFESWHAGHLKDCINYRRRGYIVHTVEIGVDDFVAWSRANNLSVNGAKRADFAIHVLVDRMREKGEM